MVLVLLLNIHLHQVAAVLWVLRTPQGHMVRFLTNVALYLERCNVLVLDTITDVPQAPYSFDVVLSCLLKMGLFYHVNLREVSAFGGKAPSLPRQDTVLAKAAILFEIGDKSRSLFVDHGNLALQDVIHGFSFVIFHKDKVI
jgi:hypothetical protein